MDSSPAEVEVSKPATPPVPEEQVPSPKDRPQSPELLGLVQGLVLAALTLLLVLKAAGSTQWRMEHDTPLLHYAAFLIDEHDLSPYRDIFETSMPGTFLFHVLVGKLFGYGDTAFRRVDLILLSLISLSSFFFMRRFGPRVGWAAAVLFPLIYLGKGNTMSLQRDYLGIVPLAIALWLIPIESRSVGLRRLAAIGALFGLSALIKPHLAIGLPLFTGALLAIRWRQQVRGRRDLVRCGVATALGFLTPIVLALIWLWSRSCLAEFSDIVFGYLPLHNAITGSRQILLGSDRLSYLFHRTLALGGYGSLAFAGLFASYHVLASAVRKRGQTASTNLVLGCAAAYALYPTLAGKFWSYHYMPTVYFLTLASALALASPRQDPATPRRTSRTIRGWLATAILLLAIQLQLNIPKYVHSTRAALAENYRPKAPKKGRVDEIAKWLAPRLKPGDTVQPLDWAAGGAIHAMLLAQARPATRYLYDYHFYHHLSRPYIRKLRRFFIADLQAARPRFVTESRVGRPRVKGHDTADSFFELEAFLIDHYRQVRRRKGYIIYERQ